MNTSNLSFLKFYFYLLLGFFTIAASLFANKYLDEFGNLPIHVTQGKGVSQKEYILHDFDGRNFVMSQKGMEEMEILLPVSSSESLKYIQKDLYNQAIALLADRKFAEGVEIFRESAYPLIKFANISNSKIDIHKPLRIFIDSLLEIGAANEIYEIYEEFDIKKVDDLFVEKIFDVTASLIQLKEYEKALKLIKRIPLSSSETQYLDNVIHAAGLFILVEEYTSALGLYERAQRFRESDLYEQVILWIAYCKVKTGDMNGSTYYLEKLDPLDNNNPDFSLYQLVQALSSIKSRDYRAAMDLISQGVVSSDRGFLWMPELLFQSALCYFNLNQKEVAKSIIDEIKLFYPNSVWSSKPL